MANEEHFAILKQGVAAWNKWRQENSDLKPDLSGAILSGTDLSCALLLSADLSGADLSGAILSDADMRGVNLSGANLVGANLSTARLNGANLSTARLNGAFLLSADLSGADLSGAILMSGFLNGADLSGANLCKANLLMTNLSCTDLGGANFNQTIVGFTTFANVDLSGVESLESMEHEGPSSVGIDTIFRSQGKILDAFLRGAGVPEDLIGYIHSIAGAIQFYSCFISYSNKDQDFADRLHSDLQAKGVRCWFAPEDLKIGDRFRVRIDESILVYDKLLLILSEHSVSSTWVEKEVETAMEKERDQNRTVLFPIRLDDAVMASKTGWAADIRRTRHIGDFRQWKSHDAYQKAFDRLLRDLKADEGGKKAGAEQ